MSNREVSLSFGNHRDVKSNSFARDWQKLGYVEIPSTKENVRLKYLDIKAPQMGHICCAELIKSNEERKKEKIDTMGHCQWPFHSMISVGSNSKR